MVNFTINLYHDGVFVSNPLQYLEGDHRIVEDIDFQGLIFSEFFPLMRRLILVSPQSFYYIKPGVPLNIGLKELKKDEHLAEFVIAAIENDCKMDLYCEHNGYNVMEMVKDGNLVSPDSDSDFSDSDKHENLDDVKDFVDFQTEGEENVEIPRISNDDPWLNKLVGDGKFIGFIDDPIPNLNGRFMLEVDDPEDDIIEGKFKAQKGVQYPAFDPQTPWDQCKPFLGMRFESPTQLKQCLANYGVAGGYQLWYMQNDMHKLLVYCGRDVSLGKCAGKRGKINTKDEASCSKSAEGESEPSKISKETTERWAKKKKEEKQMLGNQGDCTFRLWASWMSTEKSFQIKTLYPDHKCSRNYSLGSLVTFKWIAHHYAREIIDNPWLTYKYMQNSIKEKFRIEVSLGQCKRAKQCALFDHEGGLVEHYSRLWEYRQAILDSNPDLGVSEWYTQNKWFEAYQYSIRPVPGSRHWKPTSFPKPLPPVERKMPGRPRKKRIRHPTENVHGVSRRGRVMHCHKCWEAGHNKKTCTNPERPKPANFFGESSNRMDQEQQSNTNTSSAPAETFSEQMPAYSVDPVLPKPGKRSGVGSKKVSNSGSKKGMTKGSTSVPNKSRFAGSTSNNEPYISPEEHALNMDEEAVREQEIADRAEEEEQERIRFMWEAQEIADLTWEIYSQEFPEYYEDYEDNMKKIAEFNASVPPNMVIPQQVPIFLYQGFCQIKFLPNRVKL
ncbi:hypothetical protein CTI12_AA572830 [Artemisia annua]|uniref:PB1-like domain-containing protein n=1 Tax=Artemisia annua TaxID=35608 RepID=A0A2U1KRF0_ARTAN|nr:hypothetical protein CTI12_AA572830 [Artemisia annua]